MSLDDPAATRLSLLLRVRDLSDAAAWQDFVECYTPGIFQWCCRFGLQESDAADATQLVLMKLVRELQQFEYRPERGRFRGWLKTVTRNVTLDLVKSWKERASGGSSEFRFDSVDQQDPAELLLQEVERALQMELLRRASLSIQLRVKATTWQAWHLTTNEGIAAPLVAERLQMPVAEVYVARSRVLKMLKEEVRRLEEEDEHEVSSAK